MKQIFTIVFLLGCVLYSEAQVPVDIHLEQFATGLQRPVEIVNAGDERLFVLEKPGRIRIIEADGTVLPTPFLDITDIVASGGNNSERGLLGMAFHPNFENNNSFFVNYTDNNNNTQISLFQVSTDPNVADPSTRFDIINIEQPDDTHNGGCIRFGPDGYMYIGMGDGDNSNQSAANGQNTSTLLGKMLRIDVNTAQPYLPAAGNPFLNAGTDTLPEIWGIGFRNPWKFSFDSQTGDLWIADVGQNNWEEINMESAASAGGLNYGWRCYEASQTYNTNGCGSSSDYVFPIAEYSHANFNCSVTGGYVYRGETNVDMQGKFFYADYCTGDFWSLEPDDNNGWVTDIVSQEFDLGWSTFGLDYTGELYVANQTDGIIYKIMDEDCIGFVAEISIPIGTNDLMVLDAEIVSWYLDGELVQGQTDNLYENAPPGEYFVQYTTSDGCYGQSEVLLWDPNTVEEFGSEWSIRVYPNPASAVLNVSVSGQLKELSHIRLLDENGRLVRMENALSGGRELNLTIDVSDLASGNYRLELGGSAGSRTLPVLID